MASEQPNPKSALSVRTRFEIFKRDGFQCRYCGRRSPEVVLEVDHIQPLCEGGTNDPINLATACWDCNRGKGGVVLDDVITGEDPHDRAVLLLEKERQVAEYNHVIGQVNERIEREAWALVRYWNIERGEGDTDDVTLGDFSHLKNCVRRCPVEKIKEFMDLAVVRWKVNDLRYVSACVRNWVDFQQTNTDRAE